MRQIKSEVVDGQRLTKWIGAGGRKEEFLAREDAVGIAEERVGLGDAGPGGSASKVSASESPEGVTGADLNFESGIR